MYIFLYTKCILITWKRIKNYKYKIEIKEITKSSECRTWYFSYIYVYSIAFSSW